MNRTSAIALAFLAAVAWLAHPGFRESFGSHSDSTTDTKGVPLRLPSDTLWIRIDDEELPFVLTNLDQRFEAKPLIEFLRAFAVQRLKNNESPTIVVESLTKRSVDDEDAFNDFLNEITTECNVAVVILPMPAGDDPNTELRRFFDEFKQLKPAGPNRKLRSKS